MHRSMRWALFALALFVCLGAKPADKPRKLVARFTGEVTLEGDLANDTEVDIIASGPGRAKEFGDLPLTELRWTVRSDVAVGLLAGTLQEAPINTGGFIAQTESGDEIVGAFRAVVKKRGRWFFEVRGEFLITDATGDLAGIEGGGDLRGTLDLRDAQYDGFINGWVTLPN